MAEWENKKSWSFQFDVEPDEKIKDFALRMLSEHREYEEAVRKRIKQLFDEYVKIDGELAEAGYISILNVFAVGYQLGWNDHCEFRKGNNGEGLDGKRQ